MLPADIQSGTGSWDGVVFVSFSQGFVPDYNGTFFTNLSYRYNGNNDRFQTGDGYSFGNIFIANIGLSKKVCPWMDASIQLTYRNSSKDIFNKANVINTGGEWYYLDTSLNFNIDPVGFRLAGQIPVYRNLNGIQLTTTYTYTLSVYYTFNTGE